MTNSAFSPLKPLYVVSLVTVAAFAGMGETRGSETPRPNIVLILADDLGFSDLGSYGGEIRTPNLDRLARDGMRFTQFYNAAVCATSRASLMTGLYNRRTPGGFLKDNMATLAEVLQHAGYATAAIGKWHLGSDARSRPLARGFDEYYGILGGSADHFDPGKPVPRFMSKQSESKRREDFFHNEKLVMDFPDDFYSTDAYSNRAIETIRRFGSNGRPFFIYLGYTAPHFPIQAPTENVNNYRGRYRAGYVRLREERFQRQIALGVINPAITKLTAADRRTGGFSYDYDIPSWEALTVEERSREEQRMEVYAAMVDRLDQGVGRVLEALEATGAARNTVVIFLSDNGGCASWDPDKVKELSAYNQSLPVSDPRVYEYVGPGWGWAQNAPFRRFKVWTYEGGICTPLIVRWPGVVSPGTITGEPGHVVDFMPTVLQIAGANYPRRRNGLIVPPMEGEDLGPILRGGSAAPREVPFYWEVWGNRALRKGDWKIVWGASNLRWELYNLADDRAETVELSKLHPERLKTMVAEWEKMAEQAGWTPARMNIPGP
jgi:arylsulfatase A-like enzyme